MNVSECMAAGATIEASSTLVEAANVMQEQNTGFLSVVEDGRLVGVVSDRDIVVRGLAQSLNPFDTHVSDVMSIEVVCCFGNQSVEEATALMTERRIRRLPIIDREHHLLGQVTRDQLGMPAAPPMSSVKVTFSKTKTDSYGRPHKVPIKSVYITSTSEKEAAVSTAVKRLEEEEGTAWSNIADELNVDNHKDPS